MRLALGLVEANFGKAMEILVGGVAPPSMRVEGIHRGEP